jgi:large conductance mechanosensitive channel
MSMMQEFKKFAMRGNVMDMAIGIIIGAAFGKIVSSLVADVIMPPIGLLLSGVNFADLAWKIHEGTDGAEPVLLKYGTFITTIIDFIIIAFVIFMVVKGINSMKKKEEEKPAAPPAPSKEEVLLAEIRDELRKR